MLMGSMMIIYQVCFLFIPPAGPLILSLIAIVPTLVVVILVLLTITFAYAWFKKNKKVISSPQGNPNVEACETTDQITVSANPVYGIRPVSIPAHPSTDTQAQGEQEAHVHVYDYIP